MLEINNQKQNSSSAENFDLKPSSLDLSCCGPFHLNWWGRVTYFFKGGKTLSTYFLARTCTFLYSFLIFSIIATMQTKVSSWVSNHSIRNLPVRVLMCQYMLISYIEEVRQDQFEIPFFRSIIMFHFLHDGQEWTCYPNKLPLQPLQ